MIHLSILDKKRQDLLPLIAKIGNTFYLAGGTALALHIGHRDSVDFDFFVESDIDTEMLWQSIETIFKEYPLQKTQEEKNTLSCNIDSDVRLSFFGYHYPLIKPATCEEGIFIATPLDIGCMKLSAITSRATFKDYVDLYFILKKYPLEQLLQACDHKYPSLDKGLILKSLVYFDDISAEPIRFMPGFETDINTIQKYLFEVVKNYWKN